MRKRKSLKPFEHATTRSFARRSAPLFLAACVVAALSFSARAQEFRVTNVELRADAPELSGPCPLKVTFKGVIKASGPGKVQYTFTRSDGATSPTYMLEFTEAGSHTVTTDWTLGDARVLPRYKGWQAIRILYPSEIESSRKMGVFKIKCVADGQTGTKIIPTPEQQRSDQASKDAQPKPETPVVQIEIAPGAVGKPQPPTVSLTSEPQRIVRSLPSARTIWEFIGEYTGADKALRLQRSFAVGNLLSGCSGTMISPHIFMTASHCRGPGWTGFVRFVRIDEDSATPGPTAQAYSERYYARTFPWQTFGPDSAGTGDTVLWWLENGTDGVPPGIKYGHLELNPNAVRDGDQAYSFWVNPVDNFNGAPLDWTIIYSAGSATRRFDGGYRGPSTEFNMYIAGGGSGSAVNSASGHDVIGVTSIGPDGGTPRTTADTDHFLRGFDADRNSVLDPIEYDWLMTQPLQKFYLFQFDTPLKRALWMKNPVTAGGGSFTTETGGWTGKVIAGPDSETDGLWHRTAKFLPNATYRISAAVKGSRNQVSYVKFWSDSAGAASEVKWIFDAGTDFRRVTGRVTLGNFPDYRIIIGTSARSTAYVQDLTIVREDATTLDFETAEERRSWEYVGNSYVTSWGIRGSNDFSGVVVGPCDLCLRNRFVGFRPNAQYTVTFTARHVSGAMGGTPFIRIQNLGGVTVFNQNWRFNSAGEQRTFTVRFRNGGTHGQTLVLGASGDLKFMVDDIRIRESP
jgi:hypothetical protein